MKLLFLDVDGVLSSFGLHGLSSTHLDLFAQVVHKTGAEVVLSSTWRLPYGREQRMRLQQELYKRDIELFGMTPVLEHPIVPGVLYKGFLRGDEIQAYLTAASRRNNITSFAILDDDPNDEMGALKPHLVKCDGHAGLTEKEVAQLITMLGENTATPQP